MARKRKSVEAATPPRPPVAADTRGDASMRPTEPAPVAPRALREYRLTVAHRHASRDHRPGDILEIDADTAADIRARRGDGALVDVR